MHVIFFKPLKLLNFFRYFFYRKFINIDYLIWQSAKRLEKNSSDDVYLIIQEVINPDLKKRGKLDIKLQIIRAFVSFKFKN